MLVPLKSPTTIGIDAEVSLSDLVIDLKCKKLNLGFQNNFEEFFKKKQK